MKMEAETFDCVVTFVKDWPHSWVSSKTVARKLGLQHKVVKWVLRNSRNIQKELRSPMCQNKRCVWSHV